MVVGITGGIGSGKTTIVNMFASFADIAIYFSDIEAKKIINNSPKIRKQLISEFSSQVYEGDKLNRPFLADIVFKNKEKLQILNQIVHPVVNKHFDEFVKLNSSKSYILYESAILFENGSHQKCDKIITVTAPLEIRIKRVMLRDSASQKEVENRINNQWIEAKKSIQSNYFINNISLEVVKEQVEQIHQKLLVNKG